MSSKLRRRLARKAHGLQLLTEEPKVMIATPMQDHCHAAYCRSIVRLVGQCIMDGLIVAHEIAQYSMLPLSRNLLAQRAIEAGMTHLLFIDSDMQFPPDLAVRLVKHHKPIVAINCMARRRPYYLTARGPGSMEILTTTESSGIEKVERVGTGIMLIHLDVLREMPMPWFEYKWLPEKQIHAGEDFTFCDKARAAGHEIYIDHDLSKLVSHVGTFDYNPLIRAGFAEAEHAMQAAEQENKGVQHG